MPPGWDAVRAVERVPLASWHGRLWRTHWRNVEPCDWTVSLRISGRFHRGRDLFSENQVFPALYTSQAAHLAVWEMVRQRASTNLLFLQNNRLSQFDVSLTAVLDCGNPSVLGLSSAEIHGTDRRIPWAIGAAAVERGANGLIIPSAAMNGTNLVIFPTNLRPDWTATVVSTEDMPIDLPAEVIRRLQDVMQ